MGKCIYCNQPAGFLRKKHKSCHESHLEVLSKVEDGKQLIVSTAEKMLKARGDLNTLSSKISEIETSHSIPSYDRNALLAGVWESVVESFLDDGVIDFEEEKSLADFQSHFSLTQQTLNKNGAFTKTSQAVILRDILNGNLPKNLPDVQGLPINLQKGEQVVWVFEDCDYLEDKVRRQYVGGSKGVSVRIAKGLYYRAGAFKGQTIEKTERLHVDSGLIALTTKHIYFAGTQKSIRLPYSKIVSFEPFSDGIGLIKDGTNAKPQIFVTGNGWFTYNLVTNLAKM